MLDFVSQVNFDTSDETRASKLPTDKTSTTMTTVGVCTTQRVNPLLATMLNNSIDVSVCITEDNKRHSDKQNRHFKKGHVKRSHMVHP